MQPSSPPQTTSCQSQTPSPPDFSEHFRQTRSNPSCPGHQRRFLGEKLQTAQSRSPRPTLSPLDSSERYPFETLHPAMTRILPPPAQAHGAVRLWSPRRSSRSRPYAVPSPIAIHRRIVPFAPLSRHPALAQPASVIQTSAPSCWKHSSATFSSQRGFLKGTPGNYPCLLKDLIISLPRSCTQGSGRTSASLG
jgi:hypothetical protein